MGVVILQILQWVLRIILFLLLLIICLVAIVLIVPIRYRAEGEFLEKRPGVRGKVTWFFYLIYMKFAYEDEFRIEARVFGIKVYDSNKEAKAVKTVSEENNAEDIEHEQSNTSTEAVAEINVDNGKELEPDTTNVSESVEEKNSDYSLSDWEKEIEDEAQEEAQLADKAVREQKGATLEEGAESGKEKKSLGEKTEDIKQKFMDIIQKIKDIISKIQAGKLKAEHYLELWNRKETQITFGRAKMKLGKIVKAVLPRKWNVTGEIGFDNPCTTGQLMGALGAMYPLIGNHVQITPDFDEVVMNVRGNVKGHIRLGNLLYQLISLILNVHCFKLIKLVLDELSGSKKSKQGSNSKKSKRRRK